MTNTNITNLRKNIFEFANNCITYNDAINVNTKNGNFVMISEEEYNGLMETIYLMSIPGIEEKLITGMNTPTQECEVFNFED